MVDTYRLSRLLQRSVERSSSEETHAPNLVRARSSSSYYSQYILVLPVSLIYLSQYGGQLLLSGIRRRGDDLRTRETGIRSRTT